MSSIDKYVVGEARRYNPNVSVSTYNGRIVGSVNGTVVFDIADRYGYLSDSERSIIRNAMHEYDLERQERERRERERLERERQNALSSLRSGVAAARQQLASAYGVSKKLGNDVVAQADFNAALSALAGFRVGRYASKAEALKTEALGCLASVERDYREKLARIDAVSSAIRDSGSPSEFYGLNSRLSQIKVNMVGGKFNVAEIESFGAELKKLSAALTEVKALEKKLESLRSNGLIDSIVSDTLSDIRQTEISSLGDVDKIVKRVQDRLTEISDIAYKQKTAENVKVIAELAGALSACTALRELTFESTYKRKGVEGDIAELAAMVYEEYGKLASAEYTTCSSEKLQSVFKTVTEVMLGSANDERMLNMLREMLDECAVYKRDDRLLEDSFAEYTARMTELNELGVGAPEETKFDVQHPQAQLKRLNAALINADKKVAESVTATTFMMACQTMEEMGYEGVYCNRSENGLAFEAIYAKPGCDGVVWQIIASDCNIRRRLLGVKRPDGRSTDVDVVMEVAHEMDESGEVKKFLVEYSKNGGGRIKTTEHTDTKKPGCRDAILTHGYFELSKEGEEKYDAIVAKSAPKRRAVKSSYVTGATVVAVAHDEVESESKSCEARLMAKRL